MGPVWRDPSAWLIAVRISQQVPMWQEVSYSTLAWGRRSRLSIAGFANTFNPDSRSPAMSFSFPDNAESLIPDLRPGLMFFSIPDCATPLIPRSESVRRRKKTPSHSDGAREYAMLESVANYCTLGALFTIPRSIRRNSSDARLTDLSCGCFSKTT